MQRKGSPERALLLAAEWKHAAASGFVVRACGGGGAASGGGGGHGCAGPGEAGGGCGMQIKWGRGSTRGVLWHLCFLAAVGVRSRLGCKFGFLCSVKCRIW